jgi:hypothetical protein
MAHIKRKKGFIHHGPHGFNMSFAHQQCPFDVLVSDYADPIAPGITH